VGGTLIKAIWRVLPVAPPRPFTLYCFSTLELKDSRQQFA